MFAVRHLILVAIVACLSSAPAFAETKFDEARNKMVDDELVGAIKNDRVLSAMRKIPRHEFVSLAQRAQAYFDMPLPIGEQQTISAPFIVAYMTEQIDPQPTDKVLEIGTGSGYQAAVLSPLVKEVYTIEIVESLGRKAERTLKRLKYANVQCKVGDGYQGWVEHAPFDKIIVTCSPEKVPPKLVEQLKEGGRMIVPVGERYQQILYLFKKEEGKLVSEALKPTMFVPMTGKAEENRQIKPDPLNPKVYNASFEEEAEKTKEPASWHFQRQMTRVAGDDAPDGKHYVTFTNKDAGRAARCIQGLAIDGRKIRELDLTGYVRGKDIRQGQSGKELPMLAVTFYDDNRAQLGGTEIIGPWRGTFDWRKESLRIKVPPQTREAIIHIGLFGAVGEISFDVIELKMVK